MIEKKNYDKQLQVFYSKHKQKKYYTTNEVMEKMGISLRTLRYRLKELKVKYEDVPALLYKKDNVWFIHRQLIGEFIPKIRRRKTIYNKVWTTLITWAMIDAYDNEYHHQLAAEIKNSIPDGNFDYVIEQTKKGVNHVHMVTDKNYNEVNLTINEIISRYIPKSDYRISIEKINCGALTRNYMNK